MQTLGLRDDFVLASGSAELPPSPLPLKLLLELTPRARAFFGNVSYLLLGAPRTVTSSRPAPFWADVFVPGGFPKRAFFQSALYHAFAITVIWGFTVTYLQRPRTQVRNPFQDTKLTYYSVSEYLPPLNTGGERAKVELKGEPAYARQRIISVPPDPDNSRQTIITPPKLRLKQDVPLPNIVAWTATPAPPLAAAARPLAQMKTPELPPVIPPPPDFARATPKLEVPMEIIQPPPRLEARTRSPNLPAADVVEPPPSLENAKMRAANVPSPSAVEPPPSVDAAKRRLGELNVGQLAATAAAPKLPVAEQRASGITHGTTAGGGGSNGASASGGSADAAPPPPLITGGGSGSAAVGQIIALNLHPVDPTGPISVPAGNRRGTFAAGPEGKPGAPGTPDILGGGKGGSGVPGPGANGVPPGVLVAPGPATVAPGAVVAKTPSNPPPSDPKGKEILLAHAAPLRVADIARQTRPANTSTEPRKIEDEVFGPKKYYSMILNMPNLTSAGGSWIMRFAELHENGAKGNLLAPVATRKVDPAYPTELMKAHVEGTVTLYAVIRADGSVGEIRVLRGIDQRLDENARIALSRWTFRPATKNGAAVDLEAVVQIPFVARRAF